MSVVAHFYDGLTSKAHEASVHLGDQHVLEVGLAERSLFWPMDHPELKWQRTSEGVRIQYGEHPRMVLVVHDAPTASIVVKALKQAGQKDTHDSLLQYVKKAPVLIALVLMVLVVLGYLYVLPGMAERVAQVMPHSADESLGEMVWSNMDDQLNVDRELTEVLQEFADRLELSEEYDLKFFVVDEPMVNAFALPGGYIVVYTGIIDRMDDSNELVALLAHESVHVDERHSTRQLMRDIAGFAFLSVMVGDVNSILVIAAEHADKLRSMAYTRNLETEADMVGMEAMHRNDIDPAGMISLMELLQEEAGDIPEELSFLSTHPLTSERLANAERKAEELGPVASIDLELKRLFRQLQGRELESAQDDGVQ